MRVRDFMKTDVITVDIHTPIMAALDIMKHNKIKRLPVTKNGKFVGLVTRAMIRDASPSDATSLSIWELNHIISKMTVEEIMLRDPKTVSPDLPLEEAILMGRELGIGASPVLDNGELVGIITQSDLAAVVANALGLGEEDTKRITLKTSGKRIGYIKGLAEVLDAHEIPVMSLMSLPRSEEGGGWWIILRVQAKDAVLAVEDLKQKGYKVADVT